MKLGSFVRWAGVAALTAVACGEENGGSSVVITTGGGGSPNAGAAGGAVSAGAAGLAGAAGVGGDSAGGAGQSAGGAPTGGTNAGGNVSAGSGGSPAAGAAGKASGGAGSAGKASGGAAGTTSAGAAGMAAAGKAGAAGATQAGCYGELDALGVSYKKTSAKGVVEAVNLLGPIGGVLFTSGDTTKPSGDPMACEFVLTLHDFAVVLKARGFVRVGTLGSYCYRCCCAWSMTNYCRGPNDPEPSCGSSGYSNHSWGRAVDVRWLVKADGTKYDVNDPADYVKFSSTDTCGAGIAAQSGVSLELYSLLCELKSKKVFSTILTPNYNSDHRNHFHMDIGQTGAPSGFVVKSWEMGDIDDGEHADACGMGE